MKGLIIIGLFICTATHALPQFASREENRSPKQLDFGDDEVNIVPVVASSSNYGSPSESASTQYGAAVAPVAAPVPVEIPVAESRSASIQYGAAVVPSESRPVPVAYGASVAADEEEEEIAPREEVFEKQSNELESAASDLNEVSSGREGGEDGGAFAGAIPGNPGQDFPIFAEAPQTSFNCDDKVAGGYYADVEAACQAFHICGPGQDNKMTKYTFLCPNGTVFHQEYFICDWWFNVDCKQANELAVSRNAELFDAREKATLAAAERGTKGNAAAASTRVETVVPAEAPQDELEQYQFTSG